MRKHSYRRMELAVYPLAPANTKVTGKRKSRLKLRTEDATMMRCKVVYQNRQCVSTTKTIPRDSQLYYSNPRI